MVFGEVVHGYSGSLENNGMSSLTVLKDCKI